MVVVFTAIHDALATLVSHGDQWAVMCAPPSPPPTILSVFVTKMSAADLQITTFFLPSSLFLACLVFFYVDSSDLRTVLLEFISCL